MITATGTQGRFGNGQGAEFSEAYLLEYWRPKLGKWVRYRDFSGEEVSVSESLSPVEAASSREYTRNNNDVARTTVYRGRRYQGAIKRDMTGEADRGQ